MALPKNIRPEYTTTVPSTGKRIKYQPFSVKEEKVLILAAESKDPDEISNAISNVLTACITSPSDFIVEELALFDIEFIFLKTRAKSAGEKLTVRVTDPDDETFSVDHDINIDKIGIVKDEKHTNLIEVSEGVLVKMRYPDITFFNDGIQLTDMSSTIDVITRCVDSIVYGEDVYNAADLSANEVEEWVDGLTSEQFQKITEFFATMPKLSHSFTVKNTKKNTTFSIKLEGLGDFF